MAFCGFKKNKKWILKALDCSTRRVIVWVVGSHNVATFRKLYNKVKHLKNCTFSTDYWGAFSKVLPQDRHLIGKDGTLSIEQDNSDTRHHLARMTRRTKVVSENVSRVYDSMKLWAAMDTQNVFSAFQNKLLCIFR